MQNSGWMRTAARACGTLLLLTAELARSAPVEQAWEQTYNGGYTDGIGAIALDGSGNIYVLGYSVNASNNPAFLTIKYSPEGTQLWQRRYDGGAPTAIAVNAIGEVWVMGLGETTNSAAYLTIKYDPDGSELWARRLSGVNQYGTEPRALAVDASGNAFVTGFRRVTDGVDAVTTAKYSPAGEELWVRVADTMDWVSALAADGDGNVIVTGSGHDADNNVYTLTLKYDATGNLRWAAHYDGQGNSDSQPSAGLAVDPAGNVYVAAIASWPSTGANQILTLKYSSQGTLLQTTSYEDATGRWLGAGAVKLDNDGNLYLTGSSIYITNNNWAYDFITLKYDANGTPAWAARYNGQNYGLTGAGGTLALDSSGNPYVADPYGFVTVKYAADGNLRCVMSKPSGFARALAVDGSVTVYSAANS